MSIIGTIKMTANQFLEIGEDPAGVRLELVNGEVAVSPSPSPDHSYVAVKLASMLLCYAEEHDLGRIYADVDTVLELYNVRRPDILYFSKARLHFVGPKAFMGPPDLAVEIVSPSSVHMDRVDKFKLYEKNGVIHYWIVDPASRKVEAYSLRRGKYVKTGQGARREVISLPPFPGLSISLGELWPR